MPNVTDSTELRDAIERYRSTEATEVPVPEALAGMLRSSFEKWHQGSSEVFLLCRLNNFDGRENVTALAHSQEYLDQYEVEFYRYDSNRREAVEHPVRMWIPKRGNEVRIRLHESHRDSDFYWPMFAALKSDISGRERGVMSISGRNFREKLAGDPRPV